MKALNLIIFASLVGSSWCGLILNNIRDGLHSKLYGHGQHDDSIQNSPIINIKSQQQVVQSSTNQHVPNGPRGDHGSLPHSHNGHHGNNINASSYDSHHNMRGGGFRGNSASGISSHQMMKQESFKRRDGRNFGYHHDNNMFGNAQVVSSSNGVPMYSSSSNLSASASTSSSLDGASLSASSSSDIESSSSVEIIGSSIP